MELEQLKRAWQKTTQKEVKGYFISEEKLRSLIQKRSNTAVAQIKRGVRNKVMMAGSMGSLMILFSIYVFATGEAVFSFLSFSKPEVNYGVGILYLIFGLVICFISVYNAISYRKISNIEEHEKDVKTSVENILSIIKNAIKVKIYSDTLVVPATLIVLAAVDLFREHSLFPSITVLLLSVLGAIIFAVFSYLLTGYGQKKRYGEQIKILEGCLKELEENR